MKLLLAFGALHNAHVTREMTNSIIHKGCDILAMANGADQDVMELLREHEREFPHFKLIVEPTNIFVTPMWNKFLKYFLDKGYTHLAILNNDIILNSAFLRVIQNRMIGFPYENASYMGTEVDKEMIFRRPDVNHDWGKDITGGVPGIFVWLNRKHAELVYPIPEEIKIWFSDDYIYSLVRAAGYKTIMLEHLWIFHHGSQTIKESAVAHDIIQQDKINWRDIVRPMLEEKIKQLKK